MNMSGPAMLLKSLGIDPEKAMGMVQALQQAGDNLAKAVEALTVEIHEMRDEQTTHFAAIRADMQERMARIETLLQEQRATQETTTNADRSQQFEPFPDRPDGPVRPDDTPDVRASGAGESAGTVAGGEA